MGAESGTGMRRPRRTANANRLLLGERGGGPRDVVAFVLGGARTEVVDGPPEEGANDGLLQRGDDARVDRSVHESILNGVEAVSEDVVISRDAHVARDGGRCLIRLSGW